MGQNGISERPVTLWRNRDYLLLWLGQAISSLGTGISQFAFPLLVLALTHSFAAAGFAGALGQLPYLLFSLPAGALVDRWDRQRMLIVTQTIAMLQSFALAYLALRKIITVNQVIVLNAIQGIVNSLDMRSAWENRSYEDWLQA